MLLVSGGSSAIIRFMISLPFLPKGSDTSETTKPYLARFERTLCLSLLLCRTRSILDRGSSLLSLISPEGIHTSGKVPVLCRMFSPLASSLSLLSTIPIITFAFLA